MALPSFIFGGDTGQTAEGLKRQRAIANALFQDAAGAAPKNVGEGLTAIGKALLARSAMSKADRADATISEKQKPLWSTIAAALDGGSGGGAATGAGSFGDGASAFSGPVSAPTSAQDLKGGIAETAKALGISPVDLATTISYETGGTFDPMKRGPTTQWGQHRGLIQFGEPQAVEHGVDWNDPVGSQLGPDGAVASYLRKAGVKPGMGLLDIYSAINAGAPGLYDRTDENNGGAPGTVRDKVEKQMAGHRAKAVALFGGDNPVQVASLDPADGMAMAYAPQPQPRSAADAVTAMGGGAQAALPVQQQQRVAQAGGFDGFAFDGGPVAGAPPAPSAPGQGSQMRATTGANVQALMAIVANPYASDEQRALAMSMVEMQMKRNAPMTPAERMAQEKFQYERGRDRITDERWNREFELKEREAQGYRTLTTEQANAMGLPSGRVYQISPKGEIGQVEGTAPEASPTSVREFEYARQNGFTGSYAEWEAAQRKNSASSVTVNSGSDSSAFYKTADEARAKDFVDTSRLQNDAGRRLVQIDQLEGILSNVETGGLARLKQYAGEWGIDTAGLSDIQAASALIDRMVPAQRPPGSGTMSDADLALFKASLPRIINQPGGNALILQSLRGIANYDQRMGAIANQVLNREITPEAGQAAMAAIENPLARFRDATQAFPQGPQPQSDGPARPQTEEDFNALPKGALFIDPDDGKTYRKP